MSKNFPDFLKVTPTKHGKPETLKKLERARVVAAERLKARAKGESPSADPPSAATPEGTDDRAEARASVLPCPDSECSNENETAQVFNLSAARKRYFQHSQNAEAFIKHHGFRKIGFVTLTFPDKVYDGSEAQRRYNSFRTGFLCKHYGKDFVLAVRERHKDGAIHYHLLIALPFEVHTPLNLEVFRSKRWRKAEKNLRDEWKLLRETLPKYGFGRHRLEPVLTSARGICAYICKYITKAIHDPHPADKGAQLVRCPKSIKVCSSKFSWVKGRPWRQKLECLAKALRFFQVNIRNIADFKDYFGERWAYYLRPLIMAMPDKENPSVVHPLWIARFALGCMGRYGIKRVEKCKIPVLADIRAMVNTLPYKVRFEQHMEALSDAGRI